LDQPVNAKLWKEADVNGWVRDRLTYANVMATLAVFVALGGTSYAALTITGKNVKNGSLTGKDIKRSSLTTTQVKDGSLLSADFKAGQLVAGAPGPAGPAGPAGPQGPKGDTGAQGAQGDPGTSATALWAIVATDGTLVRGSHVAASVKKATGAYTVRFDQNVRLCSYQATPGGTPENGGAGPLGFVGTTGEFASTSGVWINTYNSAGSLADVPFHLAVFC
jgi:hypothetical protein